MTQASERRKIYFGFWFQRERSSSWLDSGQQPGKEMEMAPGEAAERPHSQPQAWTGEQTWHGMKLYTLKACPQRLISSARLCLLRAPQPLQKVPSKSRFQMSGPIGNTSHSNHQRHLIVLHVHTLYQGKLYCINIYYSFIQTHVKWQMIAIILSKLGTSSKGTRVSSAPSTPLQQWSHERAGQQRRGATCYKRQRILSTRTSGWFFKVCWKFGLSWKISYALNPAADKTAPNSGSIVTNSWSMCLVSHKKHKYENNT